MTEAEALHRAWLIYAAGFFVLGLTAVQLWSGKSLTNGPRLVSRVKDPTSYWLNVVLTGLVSIVFFGMTLSKIITSDGGTVAVGVAILAFIGAGVQAKASIIANIHERAEYNKPMKFSSATTTNTDVSISVRGWLRPELDHILTDFLNGYDLRAALVVNVNAVSNDVLVITFPQGIASDKLIFLVNYIQYPKHFNLEKRKIGVVGRVLLTAAFGIPDPTFTGQRATIYIPADDTEYDLVYAKVESKGVYKIQFTDMDWKPVHDARVPTTIEGL